MATFSYTGFKYSQRDGTQLISFVATVGDLKAWAGVPRKHFNYQHGFQRALSDKRVIELRDFYQEDAKNITPTSIVVAVREGAWKVEELSKLDAKGTEIYPPGLCRISFDLANLNDENTMSLVDQALVLLKNRLGSLATAEIENNLAEAFKSTIEAEAQDDALDTDDPESDSRIDFDDAPPSHMVHFFTELLAIQQGKMQVVDDYKLREVLYSLLKPAIIVDGQHRVYGAAALSETMKFSVNAIPDAAWLEQVFQFVVINQKAKAIEPAFLHSIIATSLTDDEIAALYKRLRKSGVDVVKAQFMTQINTDKNSPFENCIDFEIEGSPGFLGFPGMSALARDFKKIQRNYPGLIPENIEWSAEDTWLEHFFAFWRGVRDYFSGEDSRLWRKPAEDNPNNLLKIVTLQEIQKMVLESWADARIFKLTSPEVTYQRAKEFWAGFPSEFFTDEWKKKGLQTSVGRRILSEAIQQTRRNQDRKNWGHRRLGLFQDIE